MLNTTTTPNLPPTVYPRLLESIKMEVESGKSAIQFQRALTYWKIGRHIHKYLLKNKDRAVYGDRLFKRLSHDLGLSDRVIQRMVQFHREFPIPSTSTQFNWSHYVQLLSLPDQNKRQRIVKKLKNKKLSARALKEEIRLLKAAPKPGQKLTFTKGSLHTYRLHTPRIVTPREGYRVVDCGFGFWHQVPADGLDDLKEGEIVEATAHKTRFQLAPSARAPEDLYTFRAALDYVIDGDTVVLQIDAGFRAWTRQKLRLRGIDTPELATPQGKRAKEFLQNILQNEKHILIKTYRKDKYARYLADIFAGPKETFINQLLLDKKHAVLYDK